MNDEITEYPPGETTAPGASLPSQSLPPGVVTAVTASGNGTAIGNVYGGVHIDGGITAELLADALRQFGIMNSPAPQPDRNPVSHAVEWSGLSSTKYNLFVLENEQFNFGCFSIGKRVALTKNTLKVNSDYFKPLTPDIKEELKAMPCIFARRNSSYKATDASQLALLGKITDITCQQENIRFQFEGFKFIQQQIINENIRLFGLLQSATRNQLDEEHWSIRDGNLKQTISSLGIEIS